jgi:hypothetical protein
MIAAVITALGSLIIAILAWIRAVTVQRKTLAHELRVTQLQSDLSSSREELKSELARELAAEESRLRVQAELRVKLFEMGAKAVDEAGVTTQNLIYVYKNYWYTRADEKIAPRSRLAEVTEAVIGTGMFLPPELTEVFENARPYILGRMKQKLHEAQSNENGTEAWNVIQAAFAEANERALEFRTAALEWKRAEWQKLTGADSV